MARFRYYVSQQKKSRRLINQWDLIALLLIFAVIFALAWGARQMASPYHLGEQLTIHLAPKYLPGYAVRTVIRMAIALCFSLLFTFTVGTWAAKSERAGRLIVPIIDVLQSVPVLSFLSISIVGFIALFPNSLLGPECAAIFAIFTAQAWNMTLSFYQSLRTVPHDLKEAAAMLQLSPWQRFWKIEVPFSMSSLLWNTMMSMSASWFFVVFAEAISVSGQTIRLPGIGSYIYVATQQANKQAVLYAIITMLIVIFCYDQLLFRPLIAWSDKFKFDQQPDERAARSWLISLMQRTHLLRIAGELVTTLTEKFVNAPLFSRRRTALLIKKNQRHKKLIGIIWTTVIAALVITAGALISHFILQSMRLSQIGHVFFLGTATALRVIALLIISSVVWIPVGVWIGRKPRLTQMAQPLIQFCASFPANLIYPVFVMLIVRYNLNINIWVTPLMLLGTQWYILFNVIAGAANLPKDVFEVADNLGLKGWLWWKRVALPGIFPYFITGAITAAGGAWNASIVAEYVQWGSHVLRATGLGEYITASTIAGNFPAIALGTVMMCLFVLFFNRVLWHPLYRLAENRFMFTQT